MNTMCSGTNKDITLRISTKLKDSRGCGPNTTFRARIKHKALPKILENHTSKHEKKSTLHISVIHAG